MVADETTVLYRPVGPQELDLIAATGWRRFPPRLPEQPIFYPVLHEEYARQIAERWNVRDHGAGYVTQGEWWKAGFLMSLIYMVVWLVIGPLWWQLLGHV